MNSFIWIIFYCFTEISSYLCIYYLFAKDKFIIPYWVLTTVTEIITVIICEISYFSFGYNSIMMIPSAIILLLIPFSEKGNRLNLLLLYPSVIIIPGLFKELLRYLHFLINNTGIDFDQMTFENLYTKAIPLFLIFIYVIIRSRHAVNYSRIQIVSTSIGLICASAIISANYTMITNETVNERFYIIIGIFESMLCIVFLIVSYSQGVLLTRNFELKENEQKYRTMLKEQENYINGLINKETETRRFRHDLKAHITVLHELAKENNKRTLEEYLCKMEENAEFYKTMSYTGNVEADAVINSLCQVMREKDIDFHYDGVFVMPEAVSSFDICTILYNLLSNAIEACDKAVSGKKSADLHIEYGNNHMYILITNTCDLPDMPNASMLRSDKKDTLNHGFGISNVRRTVDKYNGVFKQSVINNIFRSEVII